MDYETLEFFGKVTKQKEVELSNEQIEFIKEFTIESEEKIIRDLILRENCKYSKHLTKRFILNKAGKTADNLIEFFTISVQIEPKLSNILCETRGFFTRIKQFISESEDIDKAIDTTLGLFTFGKTSFFFF